MGTVRINKAAPKCKPKLLTSANMATCPKELSAIARFGLLSLDLATAVIAVILCFQLFRNGGKKWTITHVIFLIIPLIPLARFVDMAMGPDDYMCTSIHHQQVLSIVLGGLPGYLFVSLYTVLVIFWIVHSYQARELHANTNLLQSVRFWAISINLLIYTLWAVLLLAIAVSSATRNESLQYATHASEVGYAAGLNIVAAAAFLIFGQKVCGTASSLCLCVAIVWVVGYFAHRAMCIDVSYVDGVSYH